MKAAMMALDQVNYDESGVISVKGLLKTINECLTPETTMDSEIIEYFKKCIYRQKYLESPAKVKPQDTCDGISKEQLYYTALASLFSNETPSDPGVMMDDMSGTEAKHIQEDSNKSTSEMLAEICRSNMEDAQIAIAYSRGSSDAYRQMYEFLTGGNQNEF